MRILLTGAGGFTGFHFARHARAQGHEVLPLTGDLCNLEGLRYTLSTLPRVPMHVVHLAGLSFVGHEKPQAFYEVNLFGTLHLIQGLIESGLSIQRVLLASSATVYGNSKDSPLNEESLLCPVQHYGMSKLAMEHMARASAVDLDLVVLRPFNYTGPGQSDNFLIPKLVSHFRHHAPFIELGNLEVEREFNDVRMVCEIYLRLLAQPALSYDTFNICSGKTYSLLNVIDTLKNLSKSEMEIRTNPKFVRASEIKSLCGDPSRLERSLGPLPDFSLEETLRWMLMSD